MLKMATNITKSTFGCKLSVTNFAITLRITNKNTLYAADVEHLALSAASFLCNVVRLITVQCYSDLLIYYITIWSCIADGRVKPMHEAFSSTSQRFLSGAKV